MENNSYFHDASFSCDLVPGAVCLLRADASEEIVQYNTELIRFYQCSSRQEFLTLTRGTFRGMVLASSYRPLAEFEDLVDENADEPLYLDFDIRTAKGHLRHADAYARRVMLEGKAYWSLFFVNAGLRKSAVERNDVTKLMGRRAFYRAALEQADKDKAKGIFGSHCPLYFNITNFKLYNSAHGYRQGDELLQHMAKVLQETFAGELMAHLSADSFIVLADSGNVTQRVEHVCRCMRRFIKSSGIEVKAGIRFYDARQSKEPVTMAFDQAKMACDSIKKDANHDWAVYQDSMGRRLLLENYVLEHFAEAMEKGHIRFYLQPIMRTFSEKLCGAEALVRWEDPQHGLLTPNLIVPVLEQAGLIHRLDMYIIRKVGELLCYQRDNDLPMLPISINVSPLDFTLMEPFAFVEETMESLNLPHDYLQLEITESALVRDKSTLTAAIAQFRQAGYKIWLDDFGSGYSSLNVLKDYSFDLLKLDMLFLRRFNEKSRSIITSIVRMAKRLGIHTLAEGVETLEQVNFLQSIGCERIQGYYYGKPMPYEAFHQYYGQHHYPLETAQETKLYQTVGLVDCLSEAPLAICFSSGQEASLLFANQALLKNLRLLGIRDIHQYNRYLQLPDHPLRVRLLQMLAKVRLLKKKRAYIFAERGRYFRITAELLSETEQLQAYRLSLSNVTMEHWESQKVQRFDAIMHNLYLSFHEIFLLNLRRDTCELLVSHDVTYESGRRYRDIDAFFSQYAQQNICEEDRQRFLSYMKRKKLQGLGSGKNGLHDIDSFRIRQDDGSDLWVRFDAVRAYFVDKEEILISVQPLSFEQKGKQETLNRIAESFGMRGSREITADILRDAMLWRSFAIPTQLMMFYKDRERRFVWANKAFLDFCGFKSLEDILGRTDEDLALHINSRAFREVEEKVLTTGETVHRQLGEILIHGHSELVYSTKYPYNVHGRVEGLVGISWAFEQSQRNYHDAVHDADTGLFNYRGMLISGIEFMDNYLRNDRDFVAVYFSVPAFGDIARKYGETARLHLLQRITRELLRGHKKGGIIAHIGSCRFIGFFQKGKNDIGVRVLQLANAIHNIRSVDGFPCTLYLQYAIGYGSETKSIEGLLRLLVKRVEEAKASRFGESIYIGDRIAFDREKFDSMDERVYMSDPETYDLVYINQSFYKDLHLPEDFTCQGKKCYEVIVGGREPCEFCTNRLLRRDRFYNWTYHNPISGIDYLLRDTFVPWRGKNYRFSMAINLNEYVSRDIEANETLYREAAITDAISIAMREEDPSEGIRKMLWKVGSELDADRVCIFELDESGRSVSSTYEWCRNGIEPMRTKLQHLPTNPCYIYQTFQENHIVMIPDYEAYKQEHPEVQQYLPDLHRFVAVPLRISDRTIGHLQIVNPKPALFQATNFLMMTLSRFIASMIRNREAIKELEHMSQRDQLTGLLNRRGLSMYVETLPDHISCAFIFGDINGLKRMNDEHGHEAGDRLITTVSSIMEEKQCEAGKGHVFRMGGDEFLMIIEDMDEAGTKPLIGQLRAAFREAGVSVALGSFVCMTPLANIDPILVKVDREMYKDKGQMKR